MVKRVKGKIRDWQGNRGIILADGDQRDAAGKPFGDSWFFVRKYNMAPHPHEVEIGEEVAFLWCHEKEGRMLATDVLRLRLLAPRMFIAHSSIDKPFVRRLAKRVRDSGVSVWLDEWEILVGDSITVRISDGLRESDYLAVVLSKASVSSPWVERELGAGLMRELSGQGVVVLPVLKEACKIPPLLADKYYADCSSDFEKGVIDLLNSIKARRYDL